MSRPVIIGLSVGAVALVLIARCLWLLLMGIARVAEEEEDARQ